MASLFRKALWIALGLSTCTRLAYLKREATFTESLQQHCPVDGKVALVTGSNTGLGYAIAQGWLRQGGTVHLLVRNKQKGEEAKNRLIEQNKGEPSCLKSGISERVHVHECDLSQIGEVRAFVEKWGQRPLHVLFNNAGAMLHGNEKTSEGIERNFAINVAGVYWLTSGLLPALRKSTNAEFLARVVTISSSGALTQDLRLDDLECQKEGFASTTATEKTGNIDTKKAHQDATFVYAHNKRAQIVLTQEWDRVEEQRFPNSARIQFHCAHPGWSETEGVKSSMPDFHQMMKGKWRSPEQGVDTMLWLASSPSMSKYPPTTHGGLFWLDREPVKDTLTGAWYSGLDGVSKRKLPQAIEALTVNLKPTAKQLAMYEYLTYENMQTKMSDA